MKTTFSVYLKLIVAISFLSCLSACEFESRSQDVPTQQTITASTSELSSYDMQKPRNENDKQLQQHRTLGKPGAAVSLNNARPLIAPTPGVYEYSLQLLSPMRDSKMTVDASVSEGITIISSARHFEFELQEGGEYLVPLTINATEEGRFYIQLHVSITTDGQSSSRVIAVILQVGETAVRAKKAAEKISVREAEAVISLPARETISPR